MPAIPVTIITGFLGSGKTTILLNLIPQLPSTYRLALLKNEFGDLAVDSQLASANSLSGVRELLNGCICCNLVGQLSDALLQLRDEVKPDRIVIETSGSAFPATLAMEVNRLADEHKGQFVLDGVVSVIDVENWEGYEDTSYTAKLQAKYTDLIIFNKWENVSEQRFDVCLDRVGDLELETAWVKSDMGTVEKDVLLGIDGALLSKEILDKGQHPADMDLMLVDNEKVGQSVKEAQAEHSHSSDHQTEVEVLSVSLKTSLPVGDASAVDDDDDDGKEPVADISSLTTLLLSAPKDEVYRIKGLLRFSSDHPPEDSSGQVASANSAAEAPDTNTTRTHTYILNWAFGRWTFTQSPALLEPQTLPSKDKPADSSSGPETIHTTIARLTLILARGESAKWKRRLEAGDSLKIAEGSNATASLQVERIH